MPGRSGVTVVTMLVCLFLSHTRLRVHWAPGIPCALCLLGERFLHNSGEPRRGIAKTYHEDERAAFSAVIAREGGRPSITEALIRESRGRGGLDRPVKPGDDKILFGSRTST